MASSTSTPSPSPNSDSIGTPTPSSTFRRTFRFPPQRPSKVSFTSPSMLSTVNLDEETMETSSPSSFFLRTFRYPPSPSPSKRIDNISSAAQNSSAFLRHLKFTFIVFRVFGLFPIETTKKIHRKNIFSFTIIAFIGGMNLYMMIFNTIPSFVIIFSQWDAKVGVVFGISLFFFLAFACLVFAASTGYGQKLEQFDALMSHATNQKGTEIRYKPLAKKQCIIQVILVNAAFSNFVIYILFFALPGITNLMPEALNTLKNVFGTSFVAHFLTLLFAPLCYLTVYQAALLYWTCCKCLRIEFQQVNKDISECDLRNVRLFKVIALRHCRLLKCLHYLHHMTKLLVMLVFALGSLIATLDMYVLLLPEVDFGFRLFAGYWLVLTACVNCILCLTAEGLHKALGDAEDHVCSKIAEATNGCDVDDLVYDIAEMICHQATVNVGLTAFGFFTVSKGLLLSIYSFIATYVIILLQTPPSSTITLIADVYNSTVSSTPMI